MATPHGLAVASPFVKGTAGSLETIKRGFDKEKLISIAASLGWLVRSTLGWDKYAVCLNLVKSSPACGGGMDRLEEAFRLDRLAQFKDGPLSATMSREDYVNHMTKHGYTQYGGGWLPKEEAARLENLEEQYQLQQQQLRQQQQRQQRQEQQPEHQASPPLDWNKDEDWPGLSLFDGGGGDGIGDSSSGVGGDNCSSTTKGGSDGNVAKVSHSSSSNSRQSISAPISSQNSGEGDRGGGDNRTGTNGSGGEHEGDDDVQGDQGGGKEQPLKNVSKNKKNKLSTPATSGEWRPRVCNWVWRGLVCPNMANGCRYAHPYKCSNRRCADGPANDCKGFHPRKGNGGGDVGKGSNVSKERRGTKPQRPNKNGGKKSSSSNNNNRNRGSGGGGNKENSSAQLRERLEAMERQLQGIPLQQQQQRRRRQQQQRQQQQQQQQQQPPQTALSYRDVTARGLTSNVSLGGSLGNTDGVTNRSVAFVPAQHDPAVLSAVVAAVMAVLEGGRQHQHQHQQQQRF